ncbi:MAG: SprT family zinc-dependent metalloprotease, partial [Salinisphaeraceae bacterium]|nr:SprT family zinc-dependent metalloprotease [Salinisphaeraceae bacterium]
HMQVPPGADVAQRKASLEAWYRQQLGLLIPPLIERYEPVMAVQVAQWRIRKMKTRWGTCNIPRRRIWINLELARLPPQCLEYIVVHEMTHLLERGHNARFYALMDRFMPDWREAQDMLGQAALS